MFMPGFLESIRNFKQSTEEMSIWSFAGLLILYLLITVGLFLFTSAGWSAFLMFFGWGLVSLVLAIVTLLVAAYLSSMYEKPVIFFDKRFFLLLVVVQCMAVVLNFNDNADNGGHYTFVERLLNTDGFRSGAGVLDVFSLPLHALYFVLLVSFVFFSFKKATKFASVKIFEGMNVSRQGSGSVLGGIVGGTLGAFAIPLMYFYQFQIFNDYQWQLFRAPIIFWPAIIMFGCIAGVIVGRLFTLPTFTKKASLLLLVVWPLSVWFSVLGIEHKMKIDLNKAAYLPTVMIYEDVLVFGVKDLFLILLQINPPIATAYYEIEGQNPDLLDFFDRTFASQTIRRYDSDGSPLGMNREVVYFLKDRIITIDQIYDTSYLEKEILQKIKPGKKYYAIKIEYRNASLGF